MPDEIDKRPPYVQKARRLQKTGHTQAAKRILMQNLMVAGVYQTPCVTELCELLRRTGQNTEASYLVEEALKENPTNTILNAIAGWIYLDLKNVETAVRRFERARTFSDSNHYAHAGAAEAYAYQNKFERADEILKAGLENNILTSRGVVARLQENYDLSEKLLKMQTARNDHFLRGFEALAITYVDISEKGIANRWLDAADSFGRVLKLYPENVKARAGLQYTEKMIP